MVNKQELIRARKEIVTQLDRGQLTRIIKNAYPKLSNSAIHYRRNRWLDGGIDFRIDQSIINYKEKVKDNIEKLYINR